MRWLCAAAFTVVLLGCYREFDRDLIDGQFGSLNSTIAAIRASGISTCAVHSDGRMWCWGNNMAGALGVDLPDGEVTPMAQQHAMTDWRFVSVASAFNPHAVAIDNEGRHFGGAPMATANWALDRATRSETPIRTQEGASHRFR